MGSKSMSGEQVCDANVNVIVDESKMLCGLLNGVWKIQPETSSQEDEAPGRTNSKDRATCMSEK